VDTAQFVGGQGADAAAAQGQGGPPVVPSLVVVFMVCSLVGVGSFLVPVVVTG
jgi:hypothetical protein